jgi:hypothetical protein
VLDRKVADKRIFPALDVGKSGTRKEELLVPRDQLSKMWVLRRILMQMGTVDAMEFLLDKMKDSKTNEDFFATMNQIPQGFTAHKKGWGARAAPFLRAAGAGRGFDKLSPNGNERTVNHLRSP